MCNINRYSTASLIPSAQALLEALRNVIHQTCPAATCCEGHMILEINLAPLCAPSKNSKRFKSGL